MPLAQHHACPLRPRGAGAPTLSAELPTRALALFLADELVVVSPAAAVCELPAYAHVGTVEPDDAGHAARARVVRLRAYVRQICAGTAGAESALSSCGHSKQAPGDATTGTTERRYKGLQGIQGGTTRRYYGQEYRAALQSETTGRQYRAALRTALKVGTT